MSLLGDARLKWVNKMKWLYETELRRNQTERSQANKDELQKKGRLRMVISKTFVAPKPVLRTSNLMFFFVRIPATYDRRKEKHIKWHFSTIMNQIPLRTVHMCIIWSYIRIKGEASREQIWFKPPPNPTHPSSFLVIVIRRFLCCIKR